MHNIGKHEERPFDNAQMADIESDMIKCLLPKFVDFRHKCLTA